MQDGLLSRYTSKLLATRGRERTLFAEDDRTHRAHPRPRPQRLGLLIVHQSKESDQVFEVHQDCVTIGRSRESDIALDDETVSRAHAIVARDEAGTYRICDQNSANGTYVNSQRVSEYVLEDGDEIQVGLIVLDFREVEPQ